MKKLIILLACCALSISAIAKGNGGKSGSGGSHSVRGHTTKNGTYVQPHHATNPNNTKRDNYSPPRRAT